MDNCFVKVSKSYKNLTNLPSEVLWISTQNIRLCKKSTFKSRKQFEKVIKVKFNWRESTLLRSRWHSFDGWMLGSDFQE
jgi:hypothetical protein